MQNNNISTEADRLGNNQLLSDLAQDTRDLPGIDTKDDRQNELNYNQNKTISDLPAGQLPRNMQNADSKLPNNQKNPNLHEQSEQSKREAQKPQQKTT